MRQGAVRGESGASTIRRWGARAALGIALALGAAEGVSRYFYEVHRIYDPELGYVAAPGVMRSTSEAPPAVSTWTLHGLRRRSPPDSARPRILALGDSFAEAAMIDDGDVFTDRLESALPRFQFLNAGRSSMSAADYAALAPVYRRRFDPRWTVIQLRPVDLAEDAFEHRDVSYFTLSEDGAVELHKVIHPQRTGPSYWLRDRSMLAYFFWVRYGEYRQELAGQQPLFHAASPPPLARPARDYPVEAVMDATAAAYAGRLTFALLAPYLPEAPAEMTPEERRIAAHCAARGYSCVNTRAGYRKFASEGRSPYGFATSSFNEGHYNQAGHELLARVVAEELERLHALL